jgi:hypothetical protein
VYAWLMDKENGHLMMVSILYKEHGKTMLSKELFLILLYGKTKQVMLVQDPIVVNLPLQQLHKINNNIFK